MDNNAAFDKNAYSKRLNALAVVNGRRNVSAFAEKVGVDRVTMGGYLSCKHLPDAETVAQICRKCGVSADYLLGQSDVQSVSLDLKTACAYTGLSEKAVEYLHALDTVKDLPPKSNRLHLLSDLLEDKGFDMFLAFYEYYAMLVRTPCSAFFSTTAEYKEISDKLKEQGFFVAVPDDQALAYFNMRILPTLINVLEKVAEKGGVSEDAE